MLASQAVIKIWSEDINGLAIKSTLNVSDKHIRQPFNQGCFEPTKRLVESIIFI